MGSESGRQGLEGGFLSVFWARGGGVLFHGQSGGPPLWVSPLGVLFEGFEGFGVCALEGARLRPFCSWHTYTRTNMDSGFPIGEHDVHVHG